MRHKRPTWLFTRWAKRARRQEALAAAAAYQEAAHRAAVRRILDEPTTVLPAVRSATPRRAPLLTRGQADRSRRR
jgi:hypothetical protein